MQKFFFLPVLLLAMAVQSNTTYAGPAEVKSVTYNVGPSHSIARQVGQILNQERVARRLPAVSYNGTLGAVAQAHANDMARRNYFSHTGADGSTIGRRVKRQGYRSCLAAENIAKGQRSAQEVMRDWMASSGHRRNNLHRRVREFGIGYSDDGRYWVLVFASRC